jgi:hypothetical protein
VGKGGARGGKGWEREGYVPYRHACSSCEHAQSTDVGWHSGRQQQGLRQLHICVALQTAWFGPIMSVYCRGSVGAALVLPALPFGLGLMLPALPVCTSLMLPESIAFNLPNGLRHSHQVDSALTSSTAPGRLYICLPLSFSSIFRFLNMTSSTCCACHAVVGYPVAGSYGSLKLVCSELHSAYPFLLLHVLLLIFCR